eukprot:121318-Rhodomonas_salina.1
MRNGYTAAATCVSIPVRKHTHPPTHTHTHTHAPPPATQRKVRHDYHDTADRTHSNARGPRGASQPDSFCDV